MQGSTLLWGNTGKVQFEEEENLIQIMYFPYYHTFTNNAYNKIQYGVAIRIPGFT